MGKPTASTVVMTLLMGILLGAAFTNIITAKSAAQDNAHNYDHLAFVTVGETGSMQAVDLRNGDVWVVRPMYPERRSVLPRASIGPDYLGNLRLDQLDEVKAKSLEARR